ncbi:MAG: SHOCT domain-containing protein [Thermodesulfobacteriota bacterium]
MVFTGRWIIPIAMMVLCFIVMRGHRGCMTGWSRSRHVVDSAREILDKRYALGEVSKEEYEKKKRDISQ